MNTLKSTVAVYPSHTAADVAVKAPQQTGFDMKKLSIVGRDCQTDEHVVSYYSTGDGSMEDTTHTKQILGHTQPKTLQHHHQNPSRESK